MRKVLKEWRFLRQKRIAYSQRVTRIDRFYQTKLLIKSLQAFSTAVETSRDEIRYLAVALRFRDAHQLTATFFQWRELTRVLALQRRATEKINRLVLKTAVEKWKCARVTRIQRMERCVQFHAEKQIQYQKVIVRTWQKHAQKSTNHKVLWRNFYKNRLLSDVARKAGNVARILYISKVRQKQLFEKNQNGIKLICEKSALSFWRGQTNRQIRRKTLQISAEEAAEKSTTKRFCARFTELRIRFLNNKKRNEFAVRFENLALIRATMSTWRKKRAEKVLENNQTNLALNFWYESTTWKVLQEWKKWHRKKKDKNKFYDEAFTSHRRAIEQRFGSDNFSIFYIFL